MPIAETIAVISCICSIVGAMKAALELPGTMRKLKHAENGRAVAPYLPARSIVQQSDYQYAALLERNVKSLERVVHLQGKHMRNQAAVLQQARLLTDSQRELIVAHHGLLAHQWAIIEKAVWIIAYLAGALVSVSFLLASRSYYTGFYTFRKWEFSIPSDGSRDSEVNYATFGLPSWMVPETHLFTSLEIIGDILGNIAAVIISILAILWPFIAAPFLGLLTQVLILVCLVPEVPEFLSREPARRLGTLLYAFGYGLLYREFVFGHLAHDAVISITCDALLLLGIGTVWFVTMPLK